MMAVELKPNYTKLCWDSEEAAKPTCTSLLSSSESTHDDDDYIAELTRQMAHRMLQDDHDKTNSSSEQNQLQALQSCGFSGWPNSTPWSPWGSSLGSPEGASQDPSPPATPDNKDHAWDSSSSSSSSYVDVVLGKLDKLTITTESTATPLAQNPGGIGFFSNQSLLFDQISQDFQQLEPNYSLKKEQVPKKQGSTNRGRKPKINGHQLETYYQYLKKGGASNGELRSPPAPAPSFGSSTSNPWLNQQARPGMRAFFLGGSGSGSQTGSSGTGVFLPCVTGNTSQSPKKRGCSPVLIPAKVVQALKVHFDRVGDLPRPNAATGFSTQNDALRGGRTSTYAHKKRRSRMAVADMNNSEMGLPQEWTY